MRKIILVISIFFCSFKNSLAQNIFRAIIRDNETKEPLVGATVTLEGTHNSSVSRNDGNIELRNIPDGEHTITFSYVGYEKMKMIFVFPLADSLRQQTIFLTPLETNLSKVIVTTTRTNSRIEDVPVRIEVIGQEEVNEETNIKPTNISKLLLESTSIQAQQTSAVNGNVSMRLQGLDGKYTQILKDGFPLYGGFSQGLSILQIPPLDLKQIEIVKGSSSSLYGSDAIAGIINLISRQPQDKKELTFLVNQTSLLGTDVNGFFSTRFGQKKQFGFSLLSSNNFQQARDINNDGFSDLPKTQTFNLSPKLYYYIDSTCKLFFGLNGSFDNRKGGDMLVLANKSDSLHRFFEENLSNRVSSQLRFEKQFQNAGKLTIKNSLSSFERSINQPSSQFSGNQFSSYSEIAYNFKIKKHQFVTGLNYTTDRFKEDSSKSHLQRDYTNYTTGFFAQDDYRPTEKFVSQIGFRTDWQNRYGSFILPRLSLMYKFTRQFYIRAGAGLGYMVPSIFPTASEQEGINNIHPLAEDTKAEKSVGGNLDFNYRKPLGDESFITFNQSFFITRITNPLVLDTFQFVNKTKPIITKGFESNLRYSLDEFQVFAGYTFVDARRVYDTVQSFVPLTPKHKLTLDIIYESEKSFSVALEGYYVSSMFRDFDTKTKSYCTFGVIAQKYFEHFTIVANCENIFDVRQTRFEEVVIPPTNNPSFRQLYAPLEGRVFNLSVRFTI